MSTSSCEPQPNESILLTIRSLLGPSEDYEYFNSQLLIFINSAFSRLRQLGIGVDHAFKITGEDEKWTDFIDDGYLEDVKEYVYLKVKVAFDPGALSGGVLNAFNERIKELEWELCNTNEIGY